MYADYAQVQVFLTFLIKAIAILGFGGCIAHSVLKHHVRLSKIYQEIPSKPPQHKAPEVNEDKVPEVNEVVEVKPFILQVEAPTPTELSAATEEVPEPTVTDLLSGINIDDLKIRPARKLASLLKIKQKVNGKDQPLSWLRAQIKKSLQDNPELLTKAIEIVLHIAA